MATRYTVTSGSSDGIVAGVPSEYPPLFPWLIGKSAVVLDVAAWRLVAPALIIALSASIVVSFALWSRLTSPAAALVISALGLLALGKPDKAYEVLALAVIVPLMLGTVAAPPGRRLHWLPAGLGAGLLVLLYQGYLVYAALGIAALIWLTWRAEADRRTYVWYVARVLAVMLVVSSWYVLPYLWAMLHGGRQVADTYESSSISASPLPFLAMTPLGVVQAAGLAGLLWLRRTVWWAPPLLTVVLGVYAYYLVGFARYVTTGHTSVLYYVFPLISTCLLAAGVLTCVHLGPALVRRINAPAGAGTGLVAIVLVFTGYSYWQFAMPVTHWTPGRTGVAVPDFTAEGASNRQAARAYLQPLPDGSRPRFSAAAAPAGTLPWFPAGQVRQAVEAVLGKGVRPRTLSCDEQLFAFLPWRGYIAVDRGSAFAPSRWDDRFAELRRLAAISDPAAFAAASANTAFGPIEVFVLRQDKTGLVWRPGGVATVVRFQPAQFAASSFAVVTDLPQNIVVAIRR
jgi:4-amino-4-deoxy-L-arabinose transferase-like glycosyltransferase